MAAAKNPPAQRSTRAAADASAPAPSPPESDPATGAASEEDAASETESAADEAVQGSAQATIPMPGAPAPPANPPPAVQAPPVAPVQRATPPAAPKPALAPPPPVAPVAPPVAPSPAAAPAQAPPSLADTPVGPPAPPLPPPAPPAAKVLVDGTGLNDGDEAPAPLRPALPLIGATLRCDNFTEIGEGIAVLGEVKDADPVSGHVLIWLPAYQRRWPLDAGHISGDKWRHVSGDYPKAGERPDFDARFRVRAAHVSDAPAPVKATPKTFTAPRVARPGFAWVELIGHGVAAIGFAKEDGRPKKDWSKGDIGEISLAAVRGSPTLFKAL